MLRDCNQIVGFATALVMHAIACPDAAKIGAQRDVTECNKRARQRSDHLVVRGAAHQRMGVCDQRDAAYRAGGFLDIDFDIADGPGQEFGLCCNPRQLNTLQR